MTIIILGNVQLVELSKAQDIEAGDGTTSVVVIAGALLEAAERLLQKGIHPTLISDAFQKAAAKAVSILTLMSIPVDLTDKESLVKVAATSLNSKVHLRNIYTRAYTSMYKKNYIIIIILMYKKNYIIIILL